MTPEEELIWVAGFFDGEGNISILRQFWFIAHHRGKNPIYGLNVAISNTNYDSILLVSKIFGGRIYPQGQKRIVFVWKPGTWRETNTLFNLSLLNN